MTSHSAQRKNEIEPANGSLQNPRGQTVAESPPAKRAWKLHAPSINRLP